MPTIIMTARTLESLKPNANKLVDYFIAFTFGLHLRVSPKGVPQHLVWLTLEYLPQNNIKQYQVF